MGKLHTVLESATLRHTRTTRLGFKRWAPNLPGILIAVSGATIVVGVFQLATHTGLAVVGPLPQGLPVFQLPSVSLDEFSTLFASAVAMALVAFADTSVLSRTFALRGGYESDRNQELIALGAANVAAGLFQGFSISSSAWRTPVAESAGAKSQVTGLVGAICIAMLLLFAPTLLRNLCGVQHCNETCAKPEFFARTAPTSCAGSFMPGRFTRRRFLIGMVGAILENLRCGTQPSCPQRNRYTSEPAGPLASGAAEGHNPDSSVPSRGVDLKH